MSTKIGRGTVIRGSIRGDGEFELEGRVEGTFDVDGDVTVADSGRVRVQSGKLSGRRVVISGAVAGAIEASASIVLEDGAKVVGDLSAPSIGIRPGGLLRGYVSTGDAPPAPARARAAARAESPATSRAESPRAESSSRAAPLRAARPATPAVKAPPPRAEKKEKLSVPAPSSSKASSKPKSKGAPVPVMPAPKKGKKAQLKKR